MEIVLQRRFISGTPSTSDFLASASVKVKQEGGRNAAEVKAQPESVDHVAMNDWSAEEPGGGDDSD